MTQHLSELHNPGFSLVLHSHIPWVLGHGNWPHGSVWLNEAASETYIPLLNALNNLADDGIRPGATIGITPVLAEQFAHPAFKTGFRQYLRMKVAAAGEDKLGFSRDNQTHFENLAEFWENFYFDIESAFLERYDQDLVRGFRDLQDRGAIEVITSCATHGYLPLIGNDNAVRAQIKTGVETYRKHFNRNPVGFWLPECAYRPGYEWISPTDSSGKAFQREGVEKYLSDCGIRYFVIDTAMLKGGKPLGVYLARFEGLKKLWEQYELDAGIRSERTRVSPYRIHTIGGNYGQPVAVLTRDERTGIQVWSGEHGYPGDGNYLEFHKKRFPGGHRYWRVTRAKADIGDKEAYYPDSIEDRLEENADHFVRLISDTLAAESGENPRQAVLCAPYDTELYGHWWFEGVRWLEKVWRKLADSQVDAVTGSEALSRVGTVGRISLPEGSWGEGGFHQIWFNPETEWCWRLIHPAEQDMVRLANLYDEDKRESVQTILKALGRELLLLEASDWPFVISTGSAPDYAEVRLRGHYDTFQQLKGILEKIASDRALNKQEEADLQRLEESKRVFDLVDPEWWK